VAASTLDAEAPRWGGMAISMADGTFEIGGLAAGDFNLVAESELGFFGLRASVAAGATDVTLILRRGGRIAVRVLDPNGAPVRDAFASARRVSGITVPTVGATVPTDARGNTEISVPTGSVELRVTKEGGLEASAIVTVSEGVTIPVEVTLTPRKETPPPGR
jgi:hypothetical protein